MELMLADRSTYARVCLLSICRLWLPSLQLHRAIKPLNTLHFSLHHRDMIPHVTVVGDDRANGGNAQEEGGKSRPGFIPRPR